MNNDAQLSIFNWLLASLPIALLIVTIMWFKWSAPRAGAIAWLVAVPIALTFFGGNAVIVAIASAKGLSLSLFVLTIVWTSVYLYNIADRLKGIEAIGKALAQLVSDPLVQALLVGWAFAGFIQGITGFGVPVAVATPLLVMMGFPVVRAAAIVLVGHGWAVTFGSLGSSYYTIQLVTGIPPEVIGPHMAMLFAIPVIATGFAVAHLQSGMAGVQRSAPLVLLVGSAMAASMWGAALVGAPQVASALAGLLGAVGIAIISRTPLFFGLVQFEQSNPILPESNTTPISSRKMGFHMAFLPYYSLIILSIASQFDPIQRAAQDLALGLSYPGFITNEGFTVQPVADYAKIRLLNHPAPLIIISLLITILIYRTKGHWQKGVGLQALRDTYSQSTATTIGVAAMVMMSIVMADTGMTSTLAKGFAEASAGFFPLVAPYIGVLGAFMTGSNTNSNAMFGLLQVETARELGIGTVTIASVQSIGGSIGSSLAPAKVMVAAALVGLSGRESGILRLVTPYVLVLVLLAGVEALVLSTILTSWER